MQPIVDTITGWLSNLPNCAAGQMITRETLLIEQGLLDSIAILDLVSFLETEFSVDLPIEEFVPENFCTALAIARLVARLRVTTSRRGPEHVAAG